MKIINALGLACPGPVIEVKKEIAKLPPTGGAVSILVDNSVATENLSKMSAQKGYGCEVKKRADREYLVTVTVGENQAGNNQTDKSQAASARADGMTGTDPVYEQCGTGTVVAIGKDRMGEGSEDLGKILIKGFIYALANLEIPPRAVIFFNSGVRLTAEGANTTDDLKALSQRGVKIMICGTCADFYNLKGAVIVGEIVNMYDIVEALRLANNVINI